MCGVQGLLCALLVVGVVRGQDELEGLKVLRVDGSVLGTLTNGTTLNIREAPFKYFTLDLCSF